MPLLWIALFLIFSPAPAAVANTNDTRLSSDEIREDYRLFLQQLKQLNSQYKEITGEISKVMKEEGLPQWDVAAVPPAPQQGVTVQETDGWITLTVDLPGIQKDTLKLTVQDGKKLLLSAFRKTETEQKTVERTIDLPSAVDPGGVKAEYENGVLTVKLPKISSKEVSIPVV